MVNHRRNYSLWYNRLEEAVSRMGGLFNAHLHLDRAGTLDESYMATIGHQILENSHISLHKKHSLIGELHSGPAYQEADFNRRVNFVVDELVAVGTVRADTLVDTTADCVGLSALERMSLLKSMRAPEIDIRLGAYSPFGFDDSKPERWELMVEAAQKADFLAALPEADEIAEYPTHIGFYEHCRRTLKLAQELKKPLHVHVDQRNEPSENGTEQLLGAVREFGAPVSDDGEPMVWAVHLISPSTYDDRRFASLVEEMRCLNVGLITCPSAAIGMRMYRPIMTPTYNSIPRVLEMLAAGIHVRIGSDNIADICSPSTTANLIDEVFVLSAALRFYQPEILARLAAGQRLSDGERAVVQDHIDRNQREINRFMGNWMSSMPVGLDVSG
jgi:cytosine deaminase